MSQIDNGAASTPSVPTSFTADDMNQAVPEANNLNVNGGYTSEDNQNGFRTIANEDDLTLQLTNRLRGTGSTVGVATADLVTFSLGGSAAVFRFNFEIISRDTGTGEGVGYTMTATFRTDGATATRIDAPFSEDDEDNSLLAADIDMVASANTAIVRVTGVSGQTLSWLALGEYITI